MPKKRDAVIVKGHFRCHGWEGLSKEGKCKLNSAFHNASFWHVRACVFKKL